MLFVFVLLFLLLLLLLLFAFFKIGNVREILCNIHLKNKLFDR